MKVVPGVMFTALTIELAIAAGEATLIGSPESMVRQHYVATQNRLAFTHVPADVARLVEEGRLTPVPGNGDYRLKGVDLPFAHPVLRAFIERTARGFRRACGERLVVTSLVRPITRQPSNSHPLSVHPAGIAVDLHIPERPECRLFLERELLALEESGVADATEERSPPHLHVAVFPRAYAVHVNRLVRDSARVAANANPERPRNRLPLPDRLRLLLGGVLALLATAAVVRILVPVKARRRNRKEL